MHVSTLSHPSTHPEVVWVSLDGYFIGARTSSTLMWRMPITCAMRQFLHEAIDECHRTHVVNPTSRHIHTQRLTI